MSIDNTLNSQAANKQIGNEEFRNEQSEYDPDLPNASAVMAAICCVSSQYAVNPSTDLAILISDLTHKLATPQYAESKLIAEVAKRLAFQWDAIVDDLHDALLASTQLDGTCH